MTEKHFGPRQKKILNFLINRSDWVKGAEIALEFEVTDRTVRSDIAYINATFKENGLIITSFNRKGYFIINKERAMEILESILNGFPVYPEERVNFIIKKLIFEKKEINIYELAESMLVSESTIENDLKKVKDIIVANNRKGSIIKQGMNIFLLGSEKCKRSLLSELLFKETYGNFLDLSKYKKYFEDYNLDKIKIMLLTIMKKYNYSINEMSINNLIIHIAITLDRIKHKNILNDSEYIGYKTDSLEYEMAKEFCDQLKVTFNIDFAKQEIDYISYLFLGKKIIKNVYEERSEINAVIESYYIDLTETLINSIYNEFGIDFTKDDILFIELVLHIKDMHSRLKNNAIIRNPVLEDLKRKYPLIFEIGVFTCNEFYKTANIKVENEHEIGFIALHLGAAYERLRRNTNSLIRVALVCSTDYSISNLLHSKI
ncbi:transcription antiterminator, partial [Clostridium sp.]|uniref:BglG family transcription antiterminator n=1 Tax=Clostridium sp. TaxID=1506 RepID=UPI001A4312CB